MIQQLTTDPSLPQPPPKARWFGIEVQDGDEWQRVDDDTLGGKWWAVGSVEPLQVAAHLGAGVYRVVWAPKDRRRQLGTSLPFEPTAHPPASAVVPAAAVVEDDAAAATEAEPEDDAATDAQPPQAKTPSRKPTNGGRRRAAADDALPQLIANSDALLHPLGQTVYLHSLAQAHTDKFHTLLLQSMQVMIESERARSREHADSLRAHYKSLDENRTELTRMILALTQAQQQQAAATRPLPELAAIEAQIRELGEQVADLADDDEQVQAAMAKLSENPNDLERALAAFQNIVGALANSPIGQALAQKLEQSTPPEQ